MSKFATLKAGFKISKKVRKYRKKLIKQMIKHRIPADDYYAILLNAESYIFADYVLVHIQNKEQAEQVNHALRSIGYNLTTPHEFSNNYHQQSL